MSARHSHVHEDVAARITRPGVVLTLPGIDRLQDYEMLLRVRGFANGEPRIVDWVEHEDEDDPADSYLAGVRDTADWSDHPWLELAQMIDAAAPLNEYPLDNGRIVLVVDTNRELIIDAAARCGVRARLIN